MTLSHTIELYWQTHTAGFKAFLFSILSLLLLLFGCSLVHTIRGVNYKFILILNLAILQSVVCYTIYSALYLNGKPWELAYFLAILSLGLYHWFLAILYFTAARKMPFTLENR
jgi:hypothetical protein